MIKTGNDFAKRVLESRLKKKFKIILKITDITFDTAILEETALQEPE